MAKPNVAVVGGGLSGLVAAWRLLERGCDVEIYESSGRWGGKAGATKSGVGAEDHGYHIFPAWYSNANHLAAELNIRGSFRDCTQFLQLGPGEYPRFRAFTNITSARYVWQNLTAGVLPFPQAFLFFYAALDLMSQPYRYRAKLDQVTVTGFLRARFYRTELIAQQFQELMLKGISVPTYEVSAMTMRNVMQFWVRSPEPMHRILKGDLQTLWIHPIVRKLEALGATLRLGHKLVGLDAEGDQVRRLRFVDASGVSRERTVDRVLLAIPVEKLVSLLDDRLYARAPDLADLRRLRAMPMAAIHVHFKRKIAGMPWPHVNLLDSRYGLSFIDVSQTWDNLDRTVLNMIASDFTDLEALSPEVAVSAMMEDLKRYLPPFGPDDVERITFQSHIEQPLFMNDVGGWAFRPDPSTQLSNLYLAGDFARSHIDLVSMEGAISTGLRAAEAIRKDLGLSPPVDVLVPPTFPRALLVAGRLALLPLAAIARAWAAWLSSPADAASDVPPFQIDDLPRWPVEVIDEAAAGDSPVTSNAC
jgi:uncharacterized protein with NAD-binding domain and iron-sulfur cluster